MGYEDIDGSLQASIYNDTLIAPQTARETQMGTAENKRRVKTAQGKKTSASSAKQSFLGTPAMDAIAAGMQTGAATKTLLGL